MKTEELLSHESTQFALFSTEDLPCFQLSALPKAEKKLTFSWLENLRIVSRQVSLFSEQGMALTGDQANQSESDDESERFFCAIASAVWEDAVELIEQRVNKHPEIDLEEYYATLGWLLGWWDGAIPVSAVLAIESDFQDDTDKSASVVNIQEIIRRHLKDDISYLRNLILQRSKKGGYRA